MTIDELAVLYGDKCILQLRGVLIVICSGFSGLLGEILLD